MNKNLTISYVTSIATNLFLLIGVFFLGWNPAMVLVAFWIEGSIMLLFAIPRAFLAKERLKKEEGVEYLNQKNKFFAVAVPAFLIFLLMGFLFIWVWLLGQFASFLYPDFSDRSDLVGPIGKFTELAGFYSVVLVLVLNYLISFIFWFFGTERSLYSSGLFIKRFGGRFVILCLTIPLYTFISDIFLSENTQNMKYFVALFILIKTNSDIEQISTDDKDFVSSDQLVSTSKE